MTSYNYNYMYGPLTASLYVLKYNVQKGEETIHTVTDPKSIQAFFEDIVGRNHEIEQDILARLVNDGL